VPTPDCWQETKTCYYNITKYSYSSRVVNIWNSLPNDVVEADTIKTFRDHLDKYWFNQDVLFNFNVNQFVCESDVKMWAKRTTAPVKTHWIVCPVVF